HMVQYRRNQKLLSETPESISDKVPYQPVKAQAIVAQAIAEARDKLSLSEAMDLLNDYGIKTQDDTAVNPHDSRKGAHPLRGEGQVHPVLGPVILLGEAASHWSVRANAVVALPPLNMALARYMVIQALAEGKVRERELYVPLNMPALCLF